MPALPTHLWDQNTSEALYQRYPQDRRHVFCTVPDCNYSMRGTRFFSVKDNCMRRMRVAHKINTEPLKDAGRDLFQKEEPLNRIADDLDVPDLESLEHVPSMHANAREELGTISGWEDDEEMETLV
jgi:hypothetical protein